jgi:hypothetical protein
MKTNLEIAWENAYSFGDRNRPREMQFIGKIFKTFAGRVKEFLFYIDTNNQYWYESRWKDTKK